MSGFARAWIFGWALSAASACGAPPVVPPADGPTTPPAPASAPVTTAPVSAAIDTRPALGAPVAFSPQAVQVLADAAAPAIWIVQRATMPVVSLRVVVPFGARNDPPGRAGLAALTAEMMEQGAGKRDAFQIAQAFELLGAEASVDVGLDDMQVSVTVTRDRLMAAVDLVADVVARPRFDAKEWGRTQPLWLDQLAQRDFEPMAVANVVARAVYFGEGHPYATPVDGNTGSVKALRLEDIKRFHAQAFRPEHGVVVLTGDVDEATARAVRTSLVSRWVGAKAPPLDARPEATRAVAARPRTVLVERPDAAQTALLLIAPGPGALASEYPAAALANVPLGGSFTSRLNSNLREDKGYTYGIKSAHLASRLAGAHVVRTAVQREVTAPALTEILREVGLLTADGPRTDEVEKARGTLRVERIETWQTVEGISAEVAQAVGLGVPPTWLGALAQRFEATTDAEVVAATRAMSLPGATIIAVGDRATIEAAFEKNGLPKPERRGPSGERL